MLKEISFLSENDIKVLKVCHDNKISLSSVRYVQHTDEEYYDGEYYLNANIKVNNRIKGQVEEFGLMDSNLVYTGEDTIHFLNVIEEIVENLLPYEKSGEIFEYTTDSIVMLLAKDSEYKQKCKKSTLILCSAFVGESFLNNEIQKITYVEEYVLNDFTYSDKHEDRIKDYISNNIQCDEFEIINKRYA